MINVKFLMGYARNAKEFGRNNAAGIATPYGVSEARSEDIREIAEHLEISTADARIFWNNCFSIGYWGEVRI